MNWLTWEAKIDQCLKIYITEEQLLKEMSVSKSLLVLPSLQVQSKKNRVDGI
jgi:hypothetical protein